MKIIFKNAPSLSELKVKLAKAGVTLGEPQLKFLGQHEGHAGISVETGGRVYCRTCDAGVWLNARR